MTEGLRTAAVAALALAGGFAWQAFRTAAIPASSPERLVAELRLAQVGSLLLTLSAGAYVGFAAAHETRLGVGLDIAFAVGFFLAAAYALVHDPRQALPVLALAFATHAVLAVGHRPGLLPDTLVPRWYTIGAAVFDACLGTMCYLPILRRR